MFTNLRFGCAQKILGTADLAIQVEVLYIIA